MRLILFFLLTLSLSSHVVHAQTKPSSNWIVLNNGDTLRGKIKEQNWDTNPVRLEFRDADGKSTSYTPNDLLSFESKDAPRFVSRKTEIDKSEHRTDQIAKKGITDKVTQTESVFLTVLVDSYYDLFRLKDRNGKIHYFIESSDFKLKELIVRKIWSNELRQVIVQNLYTADLSKLADGCDELLGKANKVNYNSKELIVFVNKLNACKGFSVDYEDELRKTTVSLSAIGGVSFSKIKFVSSTLSNDLTKGNYPVSVNGYGGLRVNLIFPQNKKRLSLFAESAYKAINTTSSLDLELKVSYVKISVGPEFTLQSTKSKIFFRGALSVGIPLSHHIDNLEDGFRELEQGIFLGVGSNVAKRIKTEIRFEASTGVSDYVYIASPVRSAYVILNYQLNKK